MNNIRKLFCFVILCSVCVMSCIYCMDQTAGAPSQEEMLEASKNVSESDALSLLGVSREELAVILESSSEPGAAEHVLGNCKIEIFYTGNAIEGAPSKEIIDFIKSNNLQLKEIFTGCRKAFSNNGSNAYAKYSICAAAGVVIGGGGKFFYDYVKNKSNRSESAKISSDELSEAKSDELS